MASYFFIQSVDSLSDAQVAGQFLLMQELAGRNNAVRVLLIQNAVFMAKNGVPCAGLDALMSRGITVLVDAFSLLQRGIGLTEVRPDLQPAEIDCVVDAMLNQHKVIWN